MGADLLLYAIPNCKMTEDRMVLLKQIVAELPDCGGGDAMYDDLAEYKADLDTAIDELIGIDGRRDVTTIDDMMITGGLSHGDLPTDSADCFDKVSMCNPIWTQLEAWLLEDKPQSTDDMTVRKTVDGIGYSVTFDSYGLSVRVDGCSQIVMVDINAERVKAILYEEGADHHVADWLLE